MNQSKLEKLRIKLTETKRKRNALDKTIKKLQEQITIEESKEFQDLIEEMEISFEEAIHLLKLSTKKKLNESSFILEKDIQTSVIGEKDDYESF